VRGSRKVERMLRMNTIGNDDYKKSLEERRADNPLLDLSIRCVEFMGYEQIGEEGMPAKGVVTRYYSIDAVSDVVVIIKLYDLTVLYGTGSLHETIWDTRKSVECEELIRDYLWNYHMVEIPTTHCLGWVGNPPIDTLMDVMKEFIEYAEGEIHAEK
jgi:hypothetical protein